MSIAFSGAALVRHHGSNKIGIICTNAIVYHYDELRFNLR